MGPSAPTRARGSAAGRDATPPSNLVPLDEAVRVLFQREVIADVTSHLARLAVVFVIRGTARNRADVLAGFDSRVIAHPANPLLLDHAPEVIVHPFQPSDHRLASRQWRRLNRFYGGRAPPGIRLGVRADRHTGKAVLPELMRKRS